MPPTRRATYTVPPTRRLFSAAMPPLLSSPPPASDRLHLARLSHRGLQFEGAILRSLFVGATSPYLVVKVRRSHLIHDTLLQMGMRKDDLKKPLKVQFAGEDGIDEGGVQKEFFQLIFAQIFDVSYGMFTYDDDSRLYWFNRSSLENEVRGACNQRGSHPFLISLGDTHPSFPH